MEIEREKEEDVLRSEITRFKKASKKVCAIITVCSIIIIIIIIIIILMTMTSQKAH